MRGSAGDGDRFTKNKTHVASVTTGKAGRVVVFLSSSGEHLKAIFQPPHLVHLPLAVGTSEGGHFVQRPVAKE